MTQNIQINQGELVIKFTSPASGKVSFRELGFADEDLIINGGFLRIVFDFESIQELDYYSVPTVEIAYTENMAETHWQCDFNGETILDKTDHHGHSTVILLNRNKISSLEHHHENKLVIHAEFPEVAHLIATDSYINLFK